MLRKIVSLYVEEDCLTGGRWHSSRAKATTLCRCKVCILRRQSAHLSLQTQNCMQQQQQPYFCDAKTTTPNFCKGQNLQQICSCKSDLWRQTQYTYESSSKENFVATRLNLVSAAEKCVSQSDLLFNMSYKRTQFRRSAREGIVTPWRVSLPTPLVRLIRPFTTLWPKQPSRWPCG